MALTVLPEGQIWRGDFVNKDRPRLALAYPSASAMLISLTSHTFHLNCAVAQWVTARITPIHAILSAKSGRIEGAEGAKRSGNLVQPASGLFGVSVLVEIGGNFALCRKHDIASRVSGFSPLGLARDCFSIQVIHLSRPDQLYNVRPTLYNSSTSTTLQLRPNKPSKQYTLYNLTSKALSLLVMVE